MQASIHLTTLGNPEAEAGEVAQSAECLPSTHKPWVQLPAFHKINTQSQHLERRREEHRKFTSSLNHTVRGQPGLYETMSRKPKINEYKLDR